MQVSKVPIVLQHVFVKIDSMISLYSLSKFLHNPVAIPPKKSQVLLGGPEGQIEVARHPEPMGFDGSVVS